MSVFEAQDNTTYTIKEVIAEGDMKYFLSSIGCYKGENITILEKSSAVIVAIKDARYGLDEELASKIILCP